MRVDASTQQKLDMALDDLVERKGNRTQAAASDEEPERGGRRRAEASRSPHRDRAGPDGRRGSSAKGRGKRRIPFEEKALLNTHCFYNSDGHLVVRLYDTEVVVLRKQEATAPEEPAKEPEKEAAVEEAKEAPAEEVPQPQEPPEKAPKADEEPAPAAEEGAAAQEAPAAPAPEGEAAEDGAKPTAEEEAAAEQPAAEAPAAAEPDRKPEAPAGGMVLVLSSGSFRTAETKFIINEALRTLGIKVTEDSEGSTQWQVTGEGVSEKFEDGMRVAIKVAMEKAADVQQYLVERIQDARYKDAQRGGQGPRPEFHDPGMPPPPHLYGPVRHARWPYSAPPGWPRPAAPGWPPPVSWYGPPPPWDPHRHPPWPRPPPPGWRGPGPQPGWYGPPPWDIGPGHHHHRHAPPPYGGGGKGGGGGGPPPGHRGPLPDSFFQ